MLYMPYRTQKNRATLIRNHCFIFELEGNNIQSQKEVPCDQ